MDKKSSQRSNILGMDITFWVIAAITQIGITALGIVAIKSDFAQRHFWPIVAAFCVLSLVNLIATGIIAIRANTSGNMVTQLTQRILYEVTGSPDNKVLLHPYFVGSGENAVLRWNIYNDSDYPSHDTQIHVQGTRNLRGQAINKYRQGIGILRPHGGGELTRPPQFQLDTEHDTKIEFVIITRSAVFWQNVYFTWNGERWVHDWTLRRQVGDNKTELLDKLPDDFPFKDAHGRFDEEQWKEHEIDISSKDEDQPAMRSTQ